MSFLRFFLGEKKKTASVAKERLQIILAHERAGTSGHDHDCMALLGATGRAAPCRTRRPA